MTTRVLARAAGACVLTGLLWLAPSAEATALTSYAWVRPDASLRVGHQVVHLYGIYVPDTGRTCQTLLRPVKCGSRAVLALDFKIRGFVTCQPLRRHRDRSMTGICRNRGVDLGAYLIERGWALARPGAPFEYYALERIARARGRGVWGLTGVAIAPPP